MSGKLPKKMTVTNLMNTNVYFKREGGGGVTSHKNPSKRLGANFDLFYKFPAHFTPLH